MVIDVSSFDKTKRKFSPIGQFLLRDYKKHDSYSGFLSCIPINLPSVDKPPLQFLKIDESQT